LAEAVNAKIIEYFIIEANEHLETLERGILELSNMANDSERINEMFRAAHSVKGGAAMLGYSSIQKTAHRLEDAFKILRENYVPVDQELESLFLKGYDILKELVEKLQGPFGLQEEEANALVEGGEPMFVRLQDYLNQLLASSGSGFAPAGREDISVPAAANLSAQIRDKLRKMLHLFKGEATGDSRWQLQNICTELAELAPHESPWQELVKTTQSAIANPQHSYRLLAPVVIKELKSGCDSMELGKGEQIAASSELKALATAKLPLILLSLEPKSAGNTLLKVFNKQQLSQLMEVLQTAG
jgi:chemotaxis protein histidine kinase CheA